MSFDPNRPVSPTEIARWFGVTPQAIHMWVRNGITWTDENGEERRLEPADFKGARKGARYWIKDLRQAEVAARSQTQRSHRGPRKTLVTA